MMLPPSIFSEFVENDDFMIVDVDMYLVHEGGHDGRWDGRSYSIRQSDDAALIDVSYTNRYEKELREEFEKRLKAKTTRNVQTHEYDLVSLLVEDVFPNFYSNKKDHEDFRSGRDEIEDMLFNGLAGYTLEAIGKDALYLGGKAYPLKETSKPGRNFFKVKKRFFCLDKTKKLDLEEIDKGFCRGASEYIDDAVDSQASRMDQENDRIVSIVKSGKYSKDGLGFLKKDDGYYVYHKVPAFCLFSKGNYYRFDKAAVGTRVYFDKYWRWDKPIVLNKYSHPFLPGFEKQKQTICLGSADKRFTGMLSELDKEHGILPGQLTYVLKYARWVIESGYPSDTDRFYPWHRLESNFQDHRISESELRDDPELKVTNRRNGNGGRQR